MEGEVQVKTFLQVWLFCCQTWQSGPKSSPVEI